MSKYVYKTYEIADVYLPAGMYTIERLRQILKEAEERQVLQKEFLQRSMQMTKDALNATRPDQK